MDESRNFLSPKKKPSSAAAPSVCLFTLLPVPLEILGEIFLNLPSHQVVCICRLVCRQWKEVADSEYLWKERCRREGYRPCNASKTPSDWRLFYFMCKKRRNLLKNPRGDEGLDGWQILENGGDKWAVHGVRMPHPDETVRSNFVTSYFMCRKRQLIDLVREGYDPSFIDDFQPDIRISEWYTPRSDCGCMYLMCVELLCQKKRPLKTFAPNTVYFGNWMESWNQMTHVFQNYGRGVRYVRFTHGGKDTQFWKGWYGIRLTDSCVEVCPAMDTT